MSAVVPIYEGQDFYIPTFEVKLRGRPLGLDVVRDITQVTYRDNIDEIDGFELTVNNWDAERRIFKYSDEDLFDPGKELELWLGYHGPDRLTLMIKGEITSLKPTFPSGGQPTLAVTGLNLLHRFRRKQVSKAYEAMSDSQIAQEIGTRLNVTIETPGENEEEQHGYLFQDNQYDIVFLINRARRIGYDVFVLESGENGSSEEPALYFGPSLDAGDVTYELTFGRSLIQFQPTLSTARQVGKVTVRGWDAVKGEKLEASATRAEVTGEADASAEMKRAFGEREEVITNRPIASLQEAQTLATETLRRMVKDMVQASGSTVGLPSLRAGSVLAIDGVGSRFGGRYFVTQTTHTIGDGGYTTQFECRREELE